MTFEETAKYLRTGESTLYKMTGEGKIPADTKNLSAIKNPLDRRHFAWRQLQRER